MTSPGPNKRHQLINWHKLLRDKPFHTIGAQEQARKWAARQGLLPQQAQHLPPYSCNCAEPKCLPQPNSGHKLAGMGQAESVPAEAQPLAQDEEAEQRPSALVIVGPSGVGKGTLIEKLMKGRSEFGFSCSHTTRAPREGEQEGVHYHFTTKEEFEKGIAEGKFLEYAYVHNNIYGTSLEAVEAVAASGKCCVLDIDVQGARQVRKSGLRAIFAFIAPPSLEELERRLRGRGTEGAEQVATRLKNAHAEMASLQELGLYDVVITNDDVEVALGQLQQVAARALAGETGAPPGLPAPPAAAAAGSVAAAPGGSGSQRDGSSRAGTPVGTTPTAAAAGVAAGSEASAAAAAPAPPNELEQWRGKVVIVTGAASGVGWALSLELAAAGVRVVAVSRRKSSLEALQAAAVEAGVPIAEFLPVVCDVTKEAEVVALPRIIAKRWPGSGVEGVVNSAAVVRGGASLLDGSTASWVEMVSTNMLGMAMVTREAVQDMVRRGVFGHIINMCCVEGHSVGEAGVGNAFYAATKHAVRAMTEGLRQEARAKGLPLRVTLVSPGAVDTPFQLGRNFGGSPKVEPLAEAGPQLAVEDVVRTVVWCLAVPPHMEVNDVMVRAVPLEQQ